MGLFALFLQFLTQCETGIIPTHFNREHIDIQEKKYIIDFLLIYGTSNWRMPQWYKNGKIVQKCGYASALKLNLLEVVKLANANFGVAILT